MCNESPNGSNANALERKDLRTLQFFAKEIGEMDTLVNSRPLT